MPRDSSPPSSARPENRVSDASRLAWAVREAQRELAAAAGEKRSAFLGHLRRRLVEREEALLEANARYLNANRNVRVALEGHTDERGGREYNLALGQKRAEAVRRSLSLLGVQDGQMEAVSFGEEKPAATGADEAAWSKNRRVELTYR